jgi:ABC-type Fe3+/spermidine/putrescine transport system ATPase subunit
MQSVNIALLKIKEEERSKMLQIKGVSKTFGKTVVLSDINLTVNKSELFFLLGPSGCGKSTLLRIIAGLEKCDRGTITFDDVEWNELLPEERGVGMLFQQYSLWPHMTVAENVGYGLKLRNETKDVINSKVNDVLAQVGLDGFGGRKPGSLSGGQQQRAALARALVLNSKLILLDEPLSNLDARLRLELRTEIRRLQQKLGLTMIYVTHDQEEAMALADRMALMHEGIIEQTGSPESIYDAPKTAFAALFFGKSTLLPVTVHEISSNSAKVLLGNLFINVPHFMSTSFKIGEEVFLVVKPNAAEPVATIAEGLEGRVIFREFQGTHISIGVETVFGIIPVMIEDFAPNIGENIKLAFKEKLLTIVPGDKIKNG